MGHLVEVNNISFSRGNKTVIKDLSLAVESGELVCLIGPNGSGKSTLLALICGDLTPQQGKILIDGAELSSYSLAHLARLRALLEQSPNLAFNFTVKEVVQMGRSAWRGRPESENDEQIIREVMDRTETYAFSERSCGDISGGEASRMHIARVLAQKTPILLLDEPGAALDIRHQEQVMALGREAADQGCAVIIVSHDLNTAAAWSDRVVLLNEGNIVAQGSPNDILTGELLTNVYQTNIEVLTHPNGEEVIIRPIHHSNK